jgi:cell division protein FtsB
MKKSFKKRKQKIYYIFDTVLLFVILYFLYNGMSGNNGLLNLIKINNEIEKNQEYLGLLKKTRENLMKKSSGLYEETLDLDLLEEEAKNSLGYIGKNNEFIIFLKKTSD